MHEKSYKKMWLKLLKRRRNYVKKVEEKKRENVDEWEYDGSSLRECVYHLEWNPEKMFFKNKTFFWFE